MIAIFFIEFSLYLPVLLQTGFLHIPTRFVSQSGQAVIRERQSMGVGVSHFGGLSILPHFSVDSVIAVSYVYITGRETEPLTEFGQIIQ
jgi:hypothetical protein